MSRPSSSSGYALYTLSLLTTLNLLDYVDRYIIASVGSLIRRDFTISDSQFGLFGTLFFLVRWWLQTDPLRPTRVSLWALACTIVAAGIVAEAWHFPQPWLPMFAGTVSVAVQLASPWIAHRERFRRKAV